MFPANLGKACLLSLLFLIIAYFQVFPQNSNTYVWETLYADNDLVLKISIYQKKDSCGDGSVPTHRFAYLVETTEHLDYYISWKMNYLDCDGNLYCQERSFDMSKYDGSTYPIESSDYLITSSKIVIPFYDVQRSTYRRQSNKLLEIPYSTEPMSIDGATSIYYGKSTILTVRGGTLGTGANWFWYRDRCGGERIGNGTTITVEPSDTTNYYVRAEGKNNTTRCAAIRVAVDKRSRRPDAIGAQTSICRNEATRLTVMGGSLGPEADWIWYAGSYGGNRIGSGTSIFVTPNQTTTYFVRAEGRYNITDYAMSRIVVFEKSMDPKSVVVLGPATICEGESVKLVVTGGQLADGASWKWYAGDCTGIPIASGPEVQVSPSTTTTFLVRGEGLCNNTIPASIAITVKKKSTGALFINKSKEAYRKGCCG
jgi:hypothetical protein